MNFWLTLGIGGLIYDYLTDEDNVTHIIRKSVPLCLAKSIYGNLLGTTDGIPVLISQYVFGEVMKNNGKLSVINNFSDAISYPRFVRESFSAMSINEAKRELSKGDHIYCYREIYSHHGIYDGLGGVYEYGGPRGNLCGVISHVSLSSFAKGDGILKKDYTANYNPDEIIARAKSRLGEDEYNPLFNNCEHFAYWCRLGMDEESEAYKNLVNMSQKVLDNIDIKELEKNNPKNNQSDSTDFSRLSASESYQKGMDYEFGINGETMDYKKACILYRQAYCYGYRVAEYALERVKKKIYVTELNTVLRTNI